MEKSLNDPKISLNAAVSINDKQTTFSNQQRILSLNEIQQQKTLANTNTVIQNGGMNMQLNHTKTDSFQKQETNNSNSNETFTALNNTLVKLEDVKPGNIPPLNLYEKNNFKIVLHFARDSPYPNIHVVVISATSTNTVSALKNFSFQAAVPKVK